MVVDCRTLSLGVASTGTVNTEGSEGLVDMTAI